MRSRLEPFGAWIALDDSTLVGINQSRARTLGLDGGALWREAPDHARPPLEVHVSVTSKCPAHCSGCYQSATRDGPEVPRDALDHTLDTLAAMGVFTVAFGGGEPLTRDDLGALATAARARGMTPVVTLSGLGLTAERALGLRDFAQVNISHDGVDGAYRAVRGFDGEAHADRAIRTLVAAGIPVGVNHVLTRDTVDRLGATVAHVRALGAREVQLLRYKPAGRAASLDYLARRLTPDQCLALGETLRALATEHGEALSLRIDCALVPLLSASLGDPAVMARFGVFGCEAGAHLGAVRRDGSFAGCSFHTSDPEAPRASADAWQSTPGLQRFRAYVAAPEAPCVGCALRAVCRGGCKVVSEHLTGAFGPDPECPRVLAHRAGLA